MTFQGCDKSLCRFHLFNSIYKNINLDKNPQSTYIFFTIFTYFLDIHRRGFVLSVISLTIHATHLGDKFINYFKLLPNGIIFPYVSITYPDKFLRI